MRVQLPLCLERKRRLRLIALPLLPWRFVARSAASEGLLPIEATGARTKSSRRRRSHRHSRQLQRTWSDPEALRQQVVAISEHSHRALQQTLHPL